MRAENSSGAHEARYEPLVAVVKRDARLSLGQRDGGRRGGLCSGGGGGGGASERKNSRFFVQVNISTRGPCLTDNALADPSCTTKGSWLLARPPQLLPIRAAAAKRSGHFDDCRCQRRKLLHFPRWSRKPSTQLPRQNDLPLLLLRDIFTRSGYLG